MRCRQTFAPRSSDNTTKSPATRAPSDDSSGLVRGTSRSPPSRPRRPPYPCVRRLAREVQGTSLSGRTTVVRGPDGRTTNECRASGSRLPVDQAADHGGQLSGVDRLGNVELKAGPQRLPPVIVAREGRERCGWSCPAASRLQTPYLSDEGESILVRHRQIAMRSCQCGTPFSGSPTCFPCSWKLTCPNSQPEPVRQLARCRDGCSHISRSAHPRRLRARAHEQRGEQGRQPALTAWATDSPASKHVE